MIWQEWFRDQFLSTPSARRATAVAVCRQLLTEHFYPRPPRGGRQIISFSRSMNRKFLSTPSARRATIVNSISPAAPLISIHALREEGDHGLSRWIPNSFISIHALREEGDAYSFCGDPLKRDFYPRPPRGGRRVLMLFAVDGRLFLSTPSARRATCRLRQRQDWETNFYPRPPRGGRLYRRVIPRPDTPISIHALREEGDVGTGEDPQPGYHFYPRPPRGGRPTDPVRSEFSVSISIHALREEGDKMP